METKETEQKILSLWDKATNKETPYVTLLKEKSNTLVVSGCKIVQRSDREQFAPGKIEVSLNCSEFNGLVVDKVFSTTSSRLIAKLRPFFEKLDTRTKKKIEITVVGESYKTAYAVVELPFTPPKPEEEPICVSELI